LVDHDGDGINDIVSGSYDPGDIWLFRGLGKGKYEKGRVLVDENGLALVHHPVELARYLQLKQKANGVEEDEPTLQARVASFGSWPAPVDWDGDGDLDLLIGSFGGRIYLRENIGTRKQPKYSGTATEIDVAVNHHAAPVVADWDGDGTWDLVVGASDGSVTWFHNTGAKGKPAFAKGAVLVEAKAPDKFLRQYLAEGQPAAPGVRAQVCVADYDLDGKLDLIVGDFCDVKELRSDLSPAEKTELDRINALERELSVDREKNKDALADLAKRRARFCTGKDVRRSHVWLYRRTGP
jgi:hypothetical protein